jgi:hypothetical protein
MDGWFDDPFFGSGQDEFHKAFDEMDSFMTEVFGVLPIAALDDAEAEAEPSEKPSGKPSEKPSEKRSGKRESHFYSSSVSAVRGPEGYCHAMKQTYDSTTDKHEMAEVRGLGEQLVSHKREVVGDKVSESHDRKNVSESEESEFNSRWTEAKKGLVLPDVGAIGLTPKGKKGRKALK